MASLPGLFLATGMPDRDWWEALWHDPAGVLRSLGLKPGMSAVDLCCGDGWFTLAMARIAANTLAIDMDGELLEAARRRAQEGGVANCRFVEGDARDIAKLVPEPVDFVLLANVFHGVPDKTPLSREVGSVLRPGGLLAILNWHARPREETQVLGRPRGPATELRMPPEAVRQAVAPAGLACVQTVELLPYHYGVIFTRKAA